MSKRMGRLLAGWLALAAPGIALAATGQDGTAAVPPQWDSKPTAAQIAAGKALSATCMGCHGAAGNSVSADFPNLAGLSYVYLYKQLLDFKSGARKSPIMAPMVLALSEQNLLDLAAYYSAQTFGPRKGANEDVPEQGGAAQLLARGKRIYTQGASACIRCHGADGAGQVGHFPSLAGQHAKYIVAQLQAFQSGRRTNDAGKMMEHAAAPMSAEDMAAVAAYLQSLR